MGQSGNKQGPEQPCSNREAFSEQPGYRAQVFHPGDTEEKRVNYRLVRQEARGGPEYWSS